MLFIMGREEVGKTDSNAFTRVDGGRSIRKAHYGGRFLILSGPASLYAGGCPAMFGTIRLLTLWAGAEHREGRRL